MNTNTATTVAIVAGTAGVLLILAGAFGVIPMNYGLFLGIASFILSGTVKKIAGVER